MKIRSSETCICRGREDNFADYETAKQAMGTSSQGHLSTILVSAKGDNNRESWCVSIAVKLDWLKRVGDPTGFEKRELGRASPVDVAVRLSRLSNTHFSRFDWRLT